MLLAIWYYHSPEGQRFLEARDLRAMLAVAGVVAAYALLRTRRKFIHQASWWLTCGRWLAAVAVATAIWLGVDWVRGEDWMRELVCALPDAHENTIRYSMLIVTGWLGWSVALFEGLRWAAIVSQQRQAVTDISEGEDGMAKLSADDTGTV